MPTSIGWTALPASTSLKGSNACPPNNFEGDPFLFSDSCTSVIRAWSGAIADTTANRLIIWGGGHNNYYGNEIYSLNLTANPITLTRLKDPTVPSNYANSANCIDGIPPGSPDFAPNSRESYGGQAFIPGPYQMYITGGSVACLEGDQSQNTWTIALNNLSNATSWIHADPTLVGPLPGSDGGFTYGNVAAYDPNTGLVFLSDSAAIYSYNVQTNTYARVSPPEGFVTSIYLSGAIDPTRKLFVLLGACPGGNCGPGDGVFVADISNPASTTQQDWTDATMADPVCAEFLSGGVNSIGAANPGIAFDSVANDFVGWPNQGNSIYIMTPDTVNRRLTCQRLTFANGPPNSSHANNAPNTSNGTFGRFRYFPALDAFVLVNDANIPGYILLLRSPATFTLSTTPSSASVNPGSSATYTVSTTALNGFTGTLALSASGLPAGATSSFNPASIAAGASSTLTVTTTSNTPASSSTVMVTGTSGTVVNSVNVTLNVVVPDFTLAVTPGSVSLAPGGTATYSVNVGALNGFAGSVSLAASGLPTGATASFSPASIGAPGSSTLTITTASGSLSSSSTVTITGTSGSLLHSANVTLVVTAPDFSLSVTPGSTSILAGGTAIYTVNVAALNGFTGTLNLAATGLPTGASPSFAPTSITKSGSSTLTITTTASTPAASSTVTITGTSGSLTHSANVTLNVTTSTSSASAISIDFVGLNTTSMAGSEVAGVVALGNWNNATGASSSSPLALLDQNGNPTTATVTWASDDVWDSSAVQNVAGNLRLMRGYLDNGFQDTTTVTVSGLPLNSNGYRVYVYADGSISSGSNIGIYQISGPGITTTSASLTYNANFTGTFTQATTSSPVGNYVILTIPNVSSFTLSAIPSTASSGYERAPVNGIQILPL